MQITTSRSSHSTQLPQSTHRPARLLGFKAPEWATAAIAEGRDPVDAGANTLAKKIITGFTSLAVAAAFTLNPVDGQAQNIAAEAFKKCEAELMADYAAKISEAQADGKPHLVPVFERRRGEAIESLCAVESRIAATRTEIAAGEQKIAANKADIVASKELGALFDEAKKIADRITARSNNPADLKALNVVYVQLQERRSAPGVAEVLPLIASVIAKEKR